jgi:hypothetical protein
MMKEQTRQWASNDRARNEIRSNSNSDLLEKTMLELGWCCRDLIVHRPRDGADLGTILIGFQFKTILDELGLAIVPKVPTAKMKRAWKQGLFRNFRDRYLAMVSTEWEASEGGE